MCDRARLSKSAETVPRPRWGLLYGCAGFTLAWLALTELVVTPGPVRTALRCVLALASLGVMLLWVRLNGVALDQQAWCECAASTISIRVIASRRSDSRLARPRPPLLPVAEEAEAHELSSIER